MSFKIANINKKHGDTNFKIPISLCVGVSVKITDVSG